MLPGRLSRDKEHEGQAGPAWNGAPPQLKRLQLPCSAAGVTGKEAPPRQQAIGVVLKGRSNSTLVSPTGDILVGVRTRAPRTRRREDGYTVGRRRWVCPGAMHALCAASRSPWRQRGRGGMLPGGIGAAFCTCVAGPGATRSVQVANRSLQSGGGLGSRDRWKGCVSCTVGRGSMWGRTHTMAWSWAWTKWQPAAQPPC